MIWFVLSCGGAIGVLVEVLHHKATVRHEDEEAHRRLMREMRNK